MVPPGGTLGTPASYDLQLDLRSSSRFASTLWLAHFRQRSRFTKLAIGALGLMPPRTQLSARNSAHMPAAERHRDAASEGQEREREILKWHGVGGLLFWLHLSHSQRDFVPLSLQLRGC